MILNFQSKTTPMIYSVDGSNLDASVYQRPPKIDSSPPTAHIQDDAVQNDVQLLPATYSFKDEHISSVDIDAVFGPLAIEDFSQVFENTCLTLKLTRSSIIKNKTELVIFDSKFYYLKDLGSMQLGSVSLPIGTASLYYVSPNLNSDELFKYLSKTLDSYDEQKFVKNKSSYVVGMDILKNFADYLKMVASSSGVHKYDFFFIETYGNKKMTTLRYSKTVHTNIHKLLNQNFKVANFKYMKVDVAISLSIKEHVVFPNTTLFDNLRTPANYFLFMNRNLNNCNQSMIEFKETSLLLKSRIVEKINCYSTLEDVLVSARKYKLVPLISAELAKSNIMGHQPVSSQKRLKNTIKKVSNMIASFAEPERSTWGYRIEVRISYPNLEDSLDLVLDALASTSILAYPTKLFQSYLRSNIWYFQSDQNR